MRKYLWFLFLLLLSTTKVYANTGTVVADPITAGDSANTHATNYELETQGGYRTVADITERNAITTPRRKIGMLVKVLSVPPDTNLYYTLSGGVANANWVEVELGGVGWSASGPSVYLTTGTNNVGIGASVPTAKLEVDGGIKAGTLELTEDEDSFFLRNVGIGTTEANYRLDVNGGMQAASGNFSGEGEFIQASTSFIDFDDGGVGVIRLGSRNIEGGSQQMDLDFTSEDNTLRLYSPTGITHITASGDLTMGEKVISPILQVGAEGTAVWDVTSAIVALYHMEETSGTTVDNFEGTAAYDGTSSASLSTVTTTGKIGNGFHFNGSTIINLGSNAGLKVAHSMGGCDWIKTTGDNENIMGNRSNSSPYNGWKLGTSPSGNLFFLVDGGVSSGASVTSSIAVNDDLWHYVCGVREEGIGIKIYIDAVQAGNATDSLFYDIGAGADNTMIGDIPLISVANGDPFVGDMDNASIYDSAITLEQIVGQYNGGLGTDIFTGGSGSVNGCFIVRDDDGNGFTEIHTLNGVIRGKIDTDGLCNDN